MDVRVKRYCRLNWLQSSVFNYERLEILRDIIGHPSKRLLSFEFIRASVFNFKHPDVLQDLTGHPS